MIFKREPVAIVNAVRLVFLAAIAFGLHLSDVQLIASMAALEAVLTLVARQQVVPVVTHDEQLDHLVTIAGAMPDPDDVPATGSPDRGAVDLIGLLTAVALVVAILCGLRFLGVI